MDIKHLLTQTFHQAMLAAGVEDPNPVIRQSQRPEFGHYQANGVMGAAKRMQTNPRALADLIVKHLPAQDHYTLEIAGSLVHQHHPHPRLRLPTHFKW